MSLCLWDLFVSSYWQMSPAILPASQNPSRAPVKPAYPCIMVRLPLPSKAAC